jgi:hypothetical protein
METMLVRLKSHDPRRGFVLRRFTYAGIKFHEERGWYRVAKDIAEHLRTVHQVGADEFTPLAFDVCSDDEAKSLDARDDHDAKVRRDATDDIKVSEARTMALTTTDLAPRSSPLPKPEAPKPPKEK